MAKIDAQTAGWADRAMPWLDSFHVGDDRIDDEHRALVEGCNTLCALAARGTEWTHASVAAAELLATVEAHFASEEALFPAIGFPRMLEHRREHDSIRRTLGKLLVPNATTDLRAAAAAARMILVEHIIRHDLAFKTFVQERRGV